MQIILLSFKAIANMRLSNEDYQKLFALRKETKGQEYREERAKIDELRLDLLNVNKGDYVLVWGDITDKFRDINNQRHRLVKNLIIEYFYYHGKGKTYTLSATKTDKIEHSWVNSLLLSEQAKSPLKYFYEKDPINHSTITFIGKPFLYTREDGSESVGFKNPTHELQQLEVLLRRCIVAYCSDFYILTKEQKETTLYEMTVRFMYILANDYDRLDEFKKSDTMLNVMNIICDNRKRKPKANKGFAKTKSLFKKL